MRTHALVLALVLAVPAVAGADELHRIRLQGISVDPSGELDEGGLVARADRGTGVRVAWERRVGSRYGLELAGAISSHDSDAFLGGVDLAASEVEMTPFTAALNIHPWAGRRADLYFGAGLAWVRFSDVDFEIPGSPVEQVSAADDLTWMAQIGLDVPVGPRYGLTFAVQYLDAEAELESLEGSPTLPLEPLVVAAGLLVRF